MIKLSKLKDDTKVVDESLNLVYVKDVKEDLQYFKDAGKKLYTTTEYQASLDARDILESAIENENDNMYEDWDEGILVDIIDEDIAKIQTVLDDILSRDKEQNIAYIQGQEIEVDYE